MIKDWEGTESQLKEDDWLLITSKNLFKFTSLSNFQGIIKNESKFCTKGNNKQNDFLYFLCLRYFKCW